MLLKNENMFSAWFSVRFFGCAWERLQWGCEGKFNYSDGPDNPNVVFVKHNRWGLSMGDTFLEFCAPDSNADGRFLVNPPLSVYEQTLGTHPLGDDMIMIGIESVAEWS